MRAVRPPAASLSLRMPHPLRSLAAALALARFLWPGAGATAAASALDIVATSAPGWPQFRGPRRDGVSDERGLLPSWPEGGPTVLWTAGECGRGYSSPIVVGERIYLTGDVDGALRVLAFDRAGRRLWDVPHGPAWARPHPGARTTPTFSAGRLYVLNAHGRLACFDAATGQERWVVEVLAQFGGKNLTWGLSENVLVDERAVYVTAGGRAALLVALDRETGAVLWQTPPLPDPAGDGAAESASYVSPILVRYAGRRLLLGCSLRQLYCADADTGVLQWTRPFPTTYSVLSMTPVPVGDAVFMSAPHGPGGALFHLQAPAGPDARVGATDGWTTPLDTLQGGVVRVGDKLVGCYYGARKGWAALDSATGAVLYQNSAWVKGAPLLAEGRLYALCEDGWMRLLETGATQFHEHGRFRLAEAKQDAWAHPVLWAGRLYLRYHETLSCYEVRAPAAP